MTAWHAVQHQAKLRAGEWLAVHGVGGIGLSAVQIGAATGAGGDSRRHRRPQAAGRPPAGRRADRQRPERRRRSRRSRTPPGAAPTWRWAASGAASLVQTALMSLRKGGRLVQVGLTSKAEQGIVGIPLDELIEAELTIVGSVGNPHIHLPALLALVGDKRLDPAGTGHRARPAGTGSGGAGADDELRHGRICTDRQLLTRPFVLLYTLHTASPSRRPSKGRPHVHLQRPSQRGARIATACAATMTAPTLPRNARRRSAEHVCRVIRDDILTGRQPAGARLTEAMVMERTGVSRTPVREGLRTLEGEGLVITYRSRGTFVTYRLTPERGAAALRRAAGAGAAPDRSGRRADDPRGAGVGGERAGALCRRARRRRAARGRAARRRLPPDDLRGQRQRAAQRAARLLERGCSWSCPSASTTPRSRGGSWTSTWRSSTRSSRVTRRCVEKRMRIHIEHGRAAFAKALTEMSRR